LIGVLAVALIAGGGLLGQDKKEAKDPPTKFKGFLPPNWGKLGLTDSQKQAVYKTQTEYKQKIDSLKAQIAKLQEEERAEMLKVLTPEQKKRLAELLTGSIDPAKDSKKDK